MLSVDIFLYELEYRYRGSFVFWSDDFIILFPYRRIIRSAFPEIRLWQPGQSRGHRRLSTHVFFIFGLYRKYVCHRGDRAWSNAFDDLRYNLADIRPGHVPISGQVVAK